MGEIEGAGCCGTLMLGWEDGQELVRMSLEDVRVDGEEISKHGECGDGSFFFGMCFLVLICLHVTLYTCSDGLFFFWLCCLHARHGG